MPVNQICRRFFRTCVKCRSEGAPTAEPMRSTRRALGFTVSYASIGDPRISNRQALAPAGSNRQALGPGRFQR